MTSSAEDSEGSSRSRVASNSRPDGADRAEGSARSLLERHPAEERHAEQVEIGRRVGPIGVDGDDVRVLEPGERLRLFRSGPGHFEGHRAVGELAFSGQEDPGERAPAELLDEVEAGDGLAGLGEGGEGRFGDVEVGRVGPADQLVDVEDPAEAVGQVGEPLVVLVGAGGRRRPPRDGRTPRSRGRPASRDRGRGRWPGSARPGSAGLRPIFKFRSARSRASQAAGPSGWKAAGSGRRSGLEACQASSNRRASWVEAGDDASSQVPVPVGAIEPIGGQPSVKTRRRNSSSTR